MGQSVDMPQIPEQMGKDKIPVISLIEYSSQSEDPEVIAAATVLGRMNKKIAEYNALVQAKDGNNKASALLLLQEIEHDANDLINQNNEILYERIRSWYLISGIAQQFLRFGKPISHGFTAEVQFYALSNAELQKKVGPLDLAQLFMQAKSAGVDAETIESLNNKLKLESYQNSPESIRNHNILRQLRKAILETLTAADQERPTVLHALLTEVNSHLYAIIQAEPKLLQQYLQYNHYSKQFDAFYDSANKKDTYEFLTALRTATTDLLNYASDETVIESYKSSPLYNPIEQKDLDSTIIIKAQKEKWSQEGARTKEQLKALAPTLLDVYNLKYLTAGNNITWTLENKVSGEMLILRAAKDKPRNSNDIESLKKTPVAEYFAQEYDTIVGYDSNRGDYTLTLIEHCSQGSLQNLRKCMSDEDTLFIQKQSTDVLLQVTDFCSRLIDENAYLTDIKLSNFLAEKNDIGSYQVKISDLKSVTCCAKGTNLRQLKRNDVICSATAQYTPPEWEVDYELVERSPLPNRNEHKVGETYYDKETHCYSVLGHNGEFYEGYSEKLGDKKTKAVAFSRIWRNIYFDMDKFMSYQVGLALYDFLTGLTIVLEGENSADRKEARAEALERLQQYKVTGEFDYSAAVFQGPEGQMLQALCADLLKTNPKERISIKEAAAKLNALKAINPQEWEYIKAKSRLQDAMERYKKHNEQFNLDPDFLQKYSAMQTFLQEIAEAKGATQDIGFLAHALESEASRLNTWMQHAAAQPQKVERFYPHYVRSLLNEGFIADLRGSVHTVHQLSAMDNAHVAERKALLNEIAAIHDGLESKMNVFLHAHNNDVAVTPIAEFAKLFEAASTLKSYMGVLKTNFATLGRENYQEVKEHLAVLAQSTTPEALTQSLKRETLYLHSIAYCKQDEAQGVPAYLIALRQSLSYHFLEKNPNATDNLSHNLDLYLASLFKPEEGNGADLIMHAKRYEQKFASKEYSKAYVEALEVNRQVTRLYTKFLGEDNNDPIVAEMKALRAEMNEALKSGIVSHEGSAETLQKVNLELVNSISYLAGPRLSQFKPVHTDKEWQQLKEDSVNVASRTTKWAQRVLMGVAMPLALVLMVGTGGVLAAPSIAAEIASAVSPTIANSAANLISFSSIWARAKVVFSGSKAVKDSDDLFNTAAGVAHNLVKPDIKAGVHEGMDSHPSKSAAPVLSPNHSGLFHHGESRVVQKHEDKDSEGEGDSGIHPIHK